VSNSGVQCDLYLGLCIIHHGISGRVASENKVHKYRLDGEIISFFWIPYTCPNNRSASGQGNSQVCSIHLACLNRLLNSFEQMLTKLLEIHGNWFCSYLGNFHCYNTKVRGMKTQLYL
jgi:hypothetical protein